MENRIAKWRKARGLKQSELADILSGFTGTHVHVTTVSRLETGKMSLSEKWLLILAKALEVQPVELIGETGKQPYIFYEDEAVVFAPPEGHPLARIEIGKDQQLYEITSESLNQVGIRRGDIVIAETGTPALATLTKGERQIAKVLCRRNARTISGKNTITLVRQFIWPSTIIRNSTDGNATPMDLEHDKIEIIAIIVSSLKQH